MNTVFTAKNIGHASHTPRYERTAFYEMEQRCPSNCDCEDCDKINVQ